MGGRTSYGGKSGDFSTVFEEVSCDFWESGRTNLIDARPQIFGQWRGTVIRWPSGQQEQSSFLEQTSETQDLVDNLCANCCQYFQICNHALLCIFDKVLNEINKICSSI